MPPACGLDESACVTSNFHLQAVDSAARRGL